MRIRITATARREARQARVAFSDRDPSSDPRFQARMEDAVQMLAQYPESGALHFHGTRKLLLAPFPYSLIYRIGANEVVIVAVAHTSQRPDHGSDR